MRSRNLVLTAILLLLLALLAVLLYFFLALIRPKAPVVSTKVEGIEHVASIYGFGASPADQLNGPIGVAADERGRIFVSDTQHHRVLIFNGKGQNKGDYLGELGKTGEEKGQIGRPEGVDVGPNGDIYVCDPKRGVVLVFDSGLNFKRELKEDNPLGVYAGKKKIYVACLDHISVYGRNLEFLERWGKRGKKIGQFDAPHGIALLKNGNLVVADGNNMRLMAMKGRDKVAWVVGSPPRQMFEKKRSFGLPGGIALDKDDYIYVADPMRHTIHIYSDKGKKIAEYGEMGEEDGKFYFPSDIAYIGGNTFVVSDTYNNRVQIVKISRPGD